MDWTTYDDQTRDADFLTAPYESFRRLFADSPKPPAASHDTVVGLCEGHLLHIWKFLFSLYKTESELPDCPALETQQVLRYVICELNFAATAWTGDKQGVPAVIHCLQRLKRFVTYLKGKLTAAHPREAEQTMDFYLRKQLPILRAELSAAKVPPNSVEVHLVAIVQQLNEFLRSAEEPQTAKQVKIIPGLADDSPLYQSDHLIAASEPVTPFRALEPVTPFRVPAPILSEPPAPPNKPYGPLGDTSTRSLLREMCGQSDSSLPDRMQKYRPSASRVSVNFSVYKDSPHYSAYAKQYTAKKSMVLDFPLGMKVGELALEDHSNLDAVQKGKWIVAEQAPRSAPRTRTVEKQLMKSVTMRQRVDSRVAFDPIFEEPERKSSDIREDSIGEKSSDQSVVPSEDEKYREVKDLMQSLAALGGREPTAERLVVGRKPVVAQPLLGRKAVPDRPATSSLKST